MPFEPGCLDGVKVLDLSRVLAGPWATQLFGDLGADVIKVENCNGGDETRSWGPPYFEDQSSYFLCANRNKRSIAIDFNCDEDLKYVKEMVKRADVIVENYKHGTLNRWGLDYSSLSALNPKLVYCSITGFNSSGPYADKPGYDALIQALSGLMSITGSQESGPTKVGVAVADLLTGLYATSGILAALLHREKTGAGQHVEVPLFETQVQCLANVLQNFLVSKKVPQRLQNSHPSIVPYGSFMTADRSIMLAIGNDQQFEKFCKCVGEKWHIDERFQHNPERVKNRLLLEKSIEDVLKTRPSQEWLGLFESKGFPFGPINDLKDLSEDPHVVATDLLTLMDDAKTPVVRSPLKFSKCRIENYRPPLAWPLQSRINWL